MINKPLNVSQLRSLMGFKSQEELRYDLEGFIKKKKLNVNFNLPKLSGIENNSYVLTETEYNALKKYFFSNLGEGIQMDIVAIRRDGDNKLISPQSGENLIE